MFNVGKYLDPVVLSRNYGWDDLWVCDEQRVDIACRRVDRAPVQESLFPCLKGVERTEGDFGEKVFSGAWSP